jgi:hypothetical protein
MQADLKATLAFRGQFFPGMAIIISSKYIRTDMLGSSFLFQGADGEMVVPPSFRLMTPKEFSKAVLARLMSA